MCALFFKSSTTDAGAFVLHMKINYIYFATCIIIIFALPVVLCCRFKNVIIHVRFTIFSLHVSYSKAIYRRHLNGVYANFISIKIGKYILNIQKVIECKKPYKNVFTSLAAASPTCGSPFNSRIISNCCLLLILSRLWPFRITSVCMFIADTEKSQMFYKLQTINLCNYIPKSCKIDAVCRSFVGNCSDDDDN